MEGDNRRMWTYEETRVLLKSYRARREEFQHSRKKKLVYHHMCNDLAAANILHQPVTPLMVENKIKNLLRAYRTAKKFPSRSNNPNTFSAFHDLLEEVFGDRSTGSTPRRGPPNYRTETVAARAPPTRYKIQLTKESPKFKVIEPISKPQNNNDRDEWDIAGRRIGFQLRSLEFEQRIIAEKLISDVMFYARRKRLSENSSVEVGSCWDDSSTLSTHITDRIPLVTDDTIETEKTNSYNKIPTNQVHVTQSSPEEYSFIKMEIKSEPEDSDEISFQ